MKTKDFFRTISIIHAALVSGVFMFAVIVLYMKQFNLKVSLNYQENIMILIAPVLATFAVIAGNLVFKKRMENVYPNQGLQTKLNIYQSALIIQMALYEGAAIFSIVSYFLYDNFAFMVITGVLFLYLLSARPTKEAVFRSGEFNEKDKFILEDPEREITDK